MPRPDHMSDDAKPLSQNEITARLIAEAEATITREMAEFVRIALKYKIDANTFLSLIGAASAQSGAPIPPAVAAAPVLDGTFRVSAFDGTFGGLIDCYQANEKSPFHELKHSVRLNYIRSLRRLKKDIGKDRVIDWSAQIVQAFFDRFASEQKISMGHEMIGKIRLLCSFGATELNDDACIRLSALIGMMRFPPAEGGGLPRLTRDQARAIRITAREHFGWDSIALAAALQFEFPKLKQLDIIGEWVPLSDPAKSEIMKGSEKWIRGLRWSDLDDSLILRRVITDGRRNQKKKEVEYSLRRSQMTMEEINRVPTERRKGPMIICEFSNLPWSANEFRRKWKIVAEKAGMSVPRSQSAGDGEEPELGAETAL
jgi:hypothetical protein